MQQLPPEVLFRLFAQGALSQHELQAVCPLVCRDWATALARPSSVWATISIEAPVRDAAFSWLQNRASAVQQLHMAKQDYPRDQPDCVEESWRASTQVQIQELLKQASLFRNLSSLKVVLNGRWFRDTTSTDLASVWDQVMALSQLQSLTLIDHDQSDQLAKGLVCLSSLTTLTSLWLQRGCECPPGCSPSQAWVPLAVDLIDLSDMVLDLQLQDLTLASMCFDSDLDSFWDVIAQLNLKHLKLDYISFPDFNYFQWHGDPAEMPAAASLLLSLRSLTIRCCGFHAIPEAFSSLTNLQSLHIMDPYQDLKVLRQMPALTWLRVHFNGIYARDYGQSLALAFPPSLLFLHVTCNVQRYAKGGSIYLRRLDANVLGACFQAGVQLQSVHIRSRHCFDDWPYAPLDGFLQLAHLQEVALPEAGLRVLPDGPWLHQLKVLDVSQNSFRTIPPVLLKYKATLRKLNLMRALSKRSAPLRYQRITCSMSKDESLESNLDWSEYYGANRGEEAFSAAKCRADYQELVDAGIDVQIDKDALLDSYVQ